METMNFTEKKQELISILKSNFVKKQDIENDMFIFVIYYHADNLGINHFNYKHHSFINEVKKELLKTL